MLGDIDLNLEPQGFELVLCKPDLYKTQIGYIKDFSDDKYTVKFNDVDELEFKIPYYLSDGNHKQVKNWNWDNCKGDYLILLNNEKYFVITYPTDVLDSGKDYKVVKCYSYEIELTKKKIRGYKNTVMLYDTSPNKAGVLNILEKQTTWKIGYIDPIVLMEINGQHYKYRTFDVSEQTWLSFLSDIEKAFDCIFKYDTINKTISAYAMQNVGKDTGLYISDANYLMSFQKNLKFDEVITQLSIYGKDNISINNVNPLGTSYIEDFSYYMNNDYMTDSLKNALVTYNALVSSKQGEFQGYLIQLDDLNATLIAKQGQLAVLEEQLKVIQDNIYTTIQSGQSDLTTLYNQQTAKQTEIDSKNTEINGVQGQIDAINSNIATLQNSISKENNFTTEQLNELDDFIHQDTWVNENISDINELYSKGLEAIRKINQPSVEYSLDVEDFLKLTEGKYDRDKLSLGDFVTVNYDKFGSDIQLRLVGFTHEYNLNKLTIDLSNSDIKNDSLRYINDILSNNVDLSTTVGMNKFIWDLSEKNNKNINELINNDLDAGKNAVLAGQHQDIKIDEHGINLSNMDNPDCQLRLLSNVMGFTTDNFKHCSLAITPDGIVGESIYGKVIGSEKLVITNTSGNFTVDGEHMTAANMDLTLNRSDGKSRILLDPDNGIKIQGNADGSWVDKFYVNTDGNLIANEMRTSNTTNFMILHDQYVDIYRNGNKLMDLGIVENQDGNPVIHYYKTDGSTYFNIWGNGNNFATIGGFNTDVSAEGNWNFSNLTQNSYPVLTSANWNNYITIPSGNYLPSTGSTITLNGHTLAFYSDGITYDGHTLVTK